MRNRSLKKQRKNKLRRGGSLSKLSPAPLNSGSIKFIDPSKSLVRSLPFIPPRGINAPPPLGPTSGPAFGLKINAPPLVGGRRKTNRNKRRKRFSKKK